MRKGIWLSVLLVSGITITLASELVAESTFQRTDEVVYGRKYGLAMTMDVFEPKSERNGAGIVIAVSGGWASSRGWIPDEYAETFVERGYVVFTVTHGSQPRFSIPEILEDMHRAVRYIRSKAKQYQIDPQRLGITGGSAGGHLSLMQGMAGQDGDPEAEDPVERFSSRVQAVACFFPPTDFLNYGKSGEHALGTGTLKNFKAPFEFVEFDKEEEYFRVIQEPNLRVEIGRKISPVYHVSADDPPTFIIHGDADKLVPIQQAELIIKALNDVSVPAKLDVKPGAVHGWPNLMADVALFADWFDRYLTE